VLFGNEEATKPLRDINATRRRRQGKQKERSQPKLVSVVEKGMYDHDPNSVQAYAVAYFLRWRCTALCDSKTAVLPGDGEQAHYKNFFA